MSELRSTNPFPDGPKHFFLDRQLLLLARDPLAYLEHVVTRYGDISRIQFGPMRIQLINDAQAVKHVLNDNAKNYVRSRPYRAMKLLLGDGLLATDGEVWARQRRLINPIFRKSVVDGFAVAITEAAQALSRTWASRAATDVAHDMVELTLGVVGSTVLSADLRGPAGRLGGQISRGIAHVGRMQRNPMHPPLAFPLPSNLRFCLDRQAIERALRGLVQSRRKESARPDDLLTRLIEARTVEGQGLTDREILDQVLTFFIAGHETTASTLSFVWMTLAQHPEVERRVHEEIDAAGDSEPSLATVARLEYTTMVVKEVLRHYPPVFMLGREAVRDDSLSGFHLPAGSELALCPYLLHRHPKHWERPSAFFPEHFAQASEQTRHRYAYLPFSAGPRACIGEYFALTQVLLVLATLARRFRLRPTSNRAPAVEAAAVLRVKGDHLPMRIDRR